MEKLKLGSSNPKSNDKSIEKVGSSGRSKLGNVILGMEKLKSGNSNPKSNDKLMEKVGRAGRSKLGRVIDGIENVGKSQTDIYTSY